MRRKEKKSGLAMRAVLVSVQTFLLQSIPLVQNLLPSTELADVLISVVNAADMKEDGLQLSKGSCTVQ